MQFDRIATVTIGPPGGEGFSIEGARVSFSVNKTKTANSNECQVSLYNLSEDTRLKIRRADDVLILRAGYRDTDFEQIKILSVGNVIDLVHAFESPDVVTKITTKDGIKLKRDTRIEISYEEGTQLSQVLKDVANRMGIPIRFIAATPQEQYLQGFCFAGLASEALNKVTDRLGLEWSIQNNELQILESGQSVPSELIKLTPDTGLLGRPQLVSSVGNNLSKNVSEKKQFSVRALLQPKLEPGGQVEVESEIMSGRYHIDSVQHAGDTHGQEWSSELKVSEL